MTKNRKYIVEIVLFFILLDALNYFFFKQDMGFLNARLHPYWLIVLFIPTRYGFLSGFIAGVFAAVHVILFHFGHFPTRMDIEKIAEGPGLDLPIAFVVIGIFLGAVRQQYKDSEQQKMLDLNESKRLLEDMQKTVETSEKARRVLEGRIVGETSTVRTLYEAAKKFETLDLQSIYQGCLNILAEHLKVEKASVYLKEGDYLILQSTYGWPQGQAAAGKILFENSIMRVTFEKKNIVTVQEILKKRGAENYEAHQEDILAMIPIRAGDGQVVGVVNIEQINFLQFNKPNLDLMEIIVDWSSRAVKNKLNYEKMKSQLIFGEQDQIFSNNYFRTALEKEFIKAREHHLKLAVGFIKFDRFGFFEDKVKALVNRRMAACLKKVAAVSDMIFLYKFEGTYAVIAPFKDKAALQATFEEFKKIYGQGGDGLPIIELVMSAGGIETALEEPITWINAILKDCRMPSF